MTEDVDRSEPRSIIYHAETRRTAAVWTRDLDGWRSLGWELVCGETELLPTSATTPTTVPAEPLSERQWWMAVMCGHDKPAGRTACQYGLGDGMYIDLPDRPIAKWTGSDLLRISEHIAAALQAPAVEWRLERRDNQRCKTGCRTTLRIDAQKPGHHWAEVTLDEFPTEAVLGLLRCAPTFTVHLEQRHVIKSTGKLTYPKRDISSDYFRRVRALVDAIYRKLDELDDLSGGAGLLGGVR